MNIGDVDIDVESKFNADIFGGVRASVFSDGKLTKHPCGIYFQNIQKDPLTGLCAVEYNLAEELGFTKIDFLHLHVYDAFKDRKEIEEFLEIEPDWSLLLVPSNIEKLFQISKQYELVSTLKPKCVDELADLLALMRPGKRHLVPMYTKNKDVTRKLLWNNDGSAYFFKKSHAFSYAYVIILQLNLIKHNRL